MHLPFIIFLPESSYVPFDLPYEDELMHDRKSLGSRFWFSTGFQNCASQTLRFIEFSKY